MKRRAPVRFGLCTAVMLSLGLAISLAGGCAAHDSTVAHPSVIADSQAASAGNGAGRTTSKWDFDGVTGEVIRTADYRIYTTCTGPVMLDRFPSFMEAALDHYCTGIADLPRPARRMDTFLFDTRDQWESFTRQLMGDRADTYLQIRRGGYTTGGRGVFWDIGLYDTMSIAAHEGWHQYSQKNLRESLPTWLEEGIATFMEGHRWQGNVPVFMPWSNAERFDQLRRAYYRGGLVSLKQLLTEQPENLLSPTSNRGVLYYYAQVWALTQFLNEGERGQYHNRLQLVLEDAAAGHLAARMKATAHKMTSKGAPPVGDSRSVRLFTIYFDSDLDAADESFQKFIRQIVATGSRHKMLEGQSPVIESTGTIREDDHPTQGPDKSQR